VTLKLVSSLGPSFSPFALTMMDGLSPVMKLLLNMVSTKKGSFDEIFVIELPDTGLL
jgi:hypothetical protein